MSVALSLAGESGAHKFVFLSSLADRKSDCVCVQAAMRENSTGPNGVVRGRYEDRRCHSR